MKVNDHRAVVVGATSGIGLEVARLKRISIGPVRLGMLPPGKWRMLTQPELSALQSALKNDRAPGGKGRE